MITFSRKDKILIILFLFVCSIYIITLRLSSINEMIPESILIILITTLTYLIKDLYPKVKNIEFKKVEIPLKNLIDEKSFINREDVIKAILEKLTTKDKFLITIHGTRGMGKSYLLMFIADILNGHINPNLLESVPTYEKKSYVCFYFDFKDINNSNDFEQTFEKKESSLEEFVTKLNFYKRKKIVVIIDNIVNIKHLTQVEEFIEKYYRYRPNDKIIVGSMYELSNLDLSANNKWSNELKCFDIKNTELLVKNKVEHNYTADKIVKIQELTNGIPQYVDLIIQHLSDNQLNINLNSAPNGMETYLDRIINETLTSNDEKVVLLLIALMCIDGAFCDFNTLYDVANLKNNGTLGSIEHIHIVNYKNNRIYMNDIFTNIVIDLFYKQEKNLYNDTCNKLIYYFDSMKDSKILYLLCREEKKTEEEIDSIKEFVYNKINIKDYNYIFKLYNYRTILHKNDLELNKLLQYAFISGLSGIGYYNIAKNEIIEATKHLVDIRNISCKLDFEILYLIADVEHLQDDFEIALSTLDALLNSTDKSIFNEFKCKCLWLIAHIYLHKCDYDNALEYFIKCKNEYEESTNKDSKFEYILSLSGIASIQITKYNLKYNYQDIFSKIDSISDDKMDCELAILRSNRHKSNWKRKIGDIDDAFKLLEKSHKRLVELNSRIQYNFDFEIADLYRNNGDFIKAKERYKIANKHAESSGDINLEIYSKIGLMLVEIAEHQNVDTPPNLINDMLALLQKAKENKFTGHVNILLIIKAILLNDIKEKPLTNHLASYGMSYECSLIDEYKLTPLLAQKIILTVH